VAKLDADEAQRFYDNLASGRWRVDKARYYHYASALSEQVNVSRRAAAGLALANAVEGAVAGTRVAQSDSGVYVAFRREAPLAALVVSDRVTNPESRIPDPLRSLAAQRSGDNHRQRKQIAADGIEHEAE
jgi:hypothetical protein